MRQIGKIIIAKKRNTYTQTYKFKKKNEIKINTKENLIKREKNYTIFVIKLLYLHCNK